MTITAPETGVQPTWQDVLQRVRDHPRMKGVTVYEDAVTEGQVAVTDGDGVLIPYVVMIRGGRAKLPMTQTGITGERNDMRKLYFGVEIYAKDAGEVGRVEDDVVDLLLGYTPTNASELCLEYSGQIQNPLVMNQNITKLGRGLLFECIFATTTPEQPIG